MNTVPRIIHFVTGGGSGATKVALDLACGHLETGRYLPLLILRRKRNTLPQAMQDRIAQTGLTVAWVDEKPKSATRAQLGAIIADFKPDVFVAHGFSEHIWGRQAAFAASVPVVVHVEHNCERYAFWRRWQARPLAARTHATVCVSQGVADHLARLGLAGPRVEIIHNGTDSERFSAGAPAWADRAPDIVMAARFARQKDQATLIRAIPLLARDGWSGHLWLAGAGKKSHRRTCEQLVRRLGVGERVTFLGHVNDPAPLFHRCRVGVLSTHYEGLPLGLIDSMSAGCATIGSEASGVTDIIQPEINGWRFPIGDEAALAKLLQRVLAGGPEVEAIVRRGQADAPARFSLSRMIADYERLCAELLNANETAG
jgi:glycosyltransferase involved in cell wall biosynthesis